MKQFTLTFVIALCLISAAARAADNVVIADFERSDDAGWIVSGNMEIDPAPAPPPKAEALYQESLRPQFHFTSATNWINDPNGLVFYDGEYHLFFQHNPLGINWGNMTWGHAVSKDLLHWTQLKDALEPDALGTIFSGSAVVDWKNTTGFSVNGQPPLVAMYTAAGGTNPESKGKKFTQCVAFSNDKGRTWTKYQNNPVIPHLVGENRDPRLIWYEPENKWIMTLYKDGSQYSLFSSTNLKEFTHLQDLDMHGCSECPDFFPMAVDGKPTDLHWVLTSASGHYLVGTFDGNRFKPEHEVRQVDFGTNYYAVQSYSDLKDGRRIQIAWMRDGKYPHMPFNGQMSFPCDMKLKSTADGYRLYRTPVKEIQLLQEQPLHLSEIRLSDNTPNPLAEVKDPLMHIEAEIELGTATDVGFEILGQKIHYAGGQLHCMGNAAFMPIEGKIKFDILVDRTSIETFIDDGRVSFTSCFLPKNTGEPISLFARGGTAKVISVTVSKVRSAW